MLGLHVNTKAMQHLARSRLLSGCLQKIAGARKCDMQREPEYSKDEIIKLSSQGTRPMILMQLDALLTLAPCFPTALSSGSKPRPP